MNRLWSRVGVRVTSVSLLVVGAAGGIYLGQDREVQQRSAEASVVAQVAVDDSQLLKQRQAEHAAARAFQRQTEANAAEKAAAAAKAAAGKAHAAERKVIAEKKAAAEAAAKKKAEEEAAAAKESDSGSGSTPEFDGDIPASCDEYSGNRATGCALMLEAGFKISQFSCLEKLWKKESGWNHKATNKSSGAYGIPQALPGKKMASAGSDWKTNPATQIEWGLGYIEGRYNTPCGAWAHSQDVGWY
ncbi:MAG: lytic transglycosylase domain-containing protein [Actinomycetota bacterium]|nr:lytic transglycosylase domain-containing protein [Actinomycetota bacterium]